MVASSPRLAFLCSGLAGAPGGRALPRPGVRPLPPAPAIPAAEPAPLGRVAFRTHRGEPAEAILGANGVWRCPQLPVLDRVLNGLFAPGRDEGSDGSGRAELARVAAWIHGEVRG